ncbi:abc1 family protein [Cystoisospora suis]|uniref:Abc1 family protein n=1 Tax=Cystoisospora suis TaxID=483139 RepID=A0A2C6KFA6_9APIC|nr:abc1 family protein [Cystoisospora suis]
MSFVLFRVFCFPRVFQIFLAMSILDGVGKQLDPHADVMKTALPYALTAVKNLFYSSSTSSSSSSTSSSSFSSSSHPAATSTSTISPTPTSSVAAAAGGGGGKKLTTEGSEE